MNLNFLKGLLIILVVIDHNEFTRSLFRDFFLGLSFHVIGFMTIPFLKPPGDWRTAEFRAYLARLYYPFLLLTCALWLIVTLTSDTPLMHRVGLLFIALYSGNADVLKNATHMGLLWFLPSFMAIVAIRTFVEATKIRLKQFLMVVLVAAHSIVGIVAQAAQDFLPLGLLPAIYIIPLSYATVWLHRSLFERVSAPFAIVLALTSYVAVKAVQMQMGLAYEVGFSFVADIRSPLAMLVNDLEGVTGTLMLFQLARVNVNGIIESCGRNSMQIYLFHAFVALAIYQGLVRLNTGWPVEALFGVSVFATVIVTLIFAIFVMRTSLLRRWIFPRSMADLFGKDTPTMLLPKP